MQPLITASRARKLLRLVPGILLPAFERLTRRQRDVLDLLSYGLCNKTIAFRLDLSEATVKAYVSGILGTFECTNRTQAALIGLSLREGLDIKLG